MHSSDENASTYLERWVGLLLLIGVTGALIAILLPFYGAIMWGSIIALLFAPLHRRLLHQLKLPPTPAALLTLLIVLLIVILPLALLLASLVREAALFYQRLQTGELNPSFYLHGIFDALPHWMRTLLDRFGLTNFSVLQSRFIAALGQGSQFVATQAFNIGQNTFEFVASLCIAVYLAFFLIRDGDSVMASLGRSTPLAPAHKKELLHTFANVIGATVRGSLVIACIQGVLGGIAFWLLGVSGPLLWGVLMAFLSLLPAVGSALVWLPVAVYFLLSGALWQGVSLLAFGMLVIGLVDNLLRPMLVGKQARIPDYVVMITTVGGMAVFGINGFVLGPVIAAMFITVWHIFGSTGGGVVRPDVR